jgi:hypothetical protein
MKIPHIGLYIVTSKHMFNMYSYCFMPFNNKKKRQGVFCTSTSFRMGLKKDTIHFEPSRKFVPIPVPLALSHLFSG